MRKLILAVLAATAFVAVGAVLNRSEALPVGSAAIGAAVDELSVMDKVHCRPGRWHHRVRPHDGCFRRIYRPRVYVAPYRVYRPYYRGRYRYRR